MQLIEQPVGALELARTPQLRMNHHGTQFALSLSKGVNATRPSVNLDIAEAMEGECWLEYVVTAAEKKAISGLGAAQRSGSQLVVLEYLGVPQSDRRTGRALDTSPHPTHQVLSKIDQGLTGR
jgi:hypothetical protein